MRIVREFRRHWRHRIYWIGVRHLIPDMLWRGEPSLSYKWRLHDLSYALQHDTYRRLHS